MKRYLLFITILLRVVRTNGQPAGTDPYPDSLQRLLQTTASDTGKAQVLFLLSDYWSDKDTARAFGYLRQYFQAGIRDDYYNGLAHFYLAGAWFDYDFSRSQQEYLTADKLLSGYETPAAWLYRSRAWHNYGALEQRKDNNRGFIGIQLDKVIPLALKAGDSAKVAFDYKEVGQVLMNFGEYGKAHVYYEQALSILRRKGNNKENIADCYISAAKTDILNNTFSRAGSWLDSAWSLLSPTPLSTYLPYWYWVEGMYLSRNGQQQRALDSLSKGVILARRLNRSYDEASILFEKYFVFKKLQNYVEAKKTLQVVYEMNKLIPLTNNKRQILYELAESEAALGNMAVAYQWLQAYSHLSDSLYTARTATEIAALEAKFRSSEKEKEILELHNRSKIQEILLWGGIVFFSGLLLFLTYRFRQRKRRAEQQLKSLQQQQQIEVTNALLNGEERERRRLARDLHDGLGGTLAGIKIGLSEIAFNSSGHNTDDPALQRIIQQVDSSVKELRHVAHNLMPESLVRSGLQVALTDLCESATTEKTRVVLQMMNISNDIPKQNQLLLYRIVQELLANVLKHAGASEVFVQCSQSENLFYITVEDDGSGFDKTLLNRQKGIGLENIRNRVDFLQGKLEIESAPGKGTVINIEINVA